MALQNIMPGTEPAPLYPYQEEAKQFVLTHPHCALFLEMGLGKTRIVIEALRVLRDRNRLSPHVLVIAPKTVARTTWVSELEKWKLDIPVLSFITNDHDKKLTSKKREERFREILEADPANGPVICLANKDIVTNIVEWFWDDRGVWPFKTVIIDESQAFKTYNSKRSKAMQRVRLGNMRRGEKSPISRLILLSGSPTPNSLEDLWSQIYLLDLGLRLGKNISEYRGRWFHPTAIIDGRYVNYRPNPGAEKEIYDAVKPVVISMKNRYIKLPPVTYTNDVVYMTENEMKRYKQLATESLIEIDPDMTVEAANAAVLSSKLSQMASGALYAGDGTKNYIPIHEHKLEMCRYIINNTDDNVLIAYHFRFEKEMLMDYLSTKQDKDDRAVVPEEFDGSVEMTERWNRGEISVMLLQPAAHGAGINLQDGGHTLIWYTLPWSLEQYEQANTRLYRQGQKNPVIIHRLLTDKTIDSHILSALEKKDTTQQNLLRAVESVVNGIKEE